MVCPNDGKLKCSRWMLKSISGEFFNYKVHLYKNDFTPTEVSVTGDFTEADFPGYAEVPLERATFLDPIIIADVAYAEYPTAPQYVCDGGTGQLVYGWYMTEDGEDVTLFAQRFDTPRNMTTGAVETLNPFLIGLKTLD